MDPSTPESLPPSSPPPLVLLLELHAAAAAVAENAVARRTRELLRMSRLQSGVESRFLQVGDRFVRDVTETTQFTSRAALFRLLTCVPSYIGTGTRCPVDGRV
jgi:hypothetical protein